MAETLFSHITFHKIRLWSSHMETHFVSVIYANYSYLFFLFFFWTSLIVAWSNVNQISCEFVQPIARYKPLPLEKQSTLVVLVNLVNIPDRVPWLVPWLVHDLFHVDLFKCPAFVKSEWADKIKANWDFQISFKSEWWFIFPSIEIWEN